jgi:hypothetical protein
MKKDKKKVVAIPMKKKEGVIVTQTMYLLLNVLVPAILEVCHKKHRGNWFRKVILTVFFSNHDTDEMRQTEREVFFKLYSCMPFNKWERPITFDNIFFEKEGENPDKSVQIYSLSTIPHKERQLLEVVYELHSLGIGVIEIDSPEEEEYKDK